MVTKEIGGMYCGNIYFNMRKLLQIFVSTYDGLVSTVLPSPSMNGTALFCPDLKFCFKVIVYVSEHKSGVFIAEFHSYKAALQRSDRRLLQFLCTCCLQIILG